MYLTVKKYLKINGNFEFEYFNLKILANILNFKITWFFK